MPESRPLPVRMLTLSILAVTVSALPVFLLGAAALRIGDELGFGPRGLGALTAVFFLTSAAGSPPAGRVVERVGWHKALRLNILISSVILAAIAAGARSVWVLAVLLAAAAGSYSFSNPSANLALAGSVAPGRHGIAFGLKHAGIPSSALLAGLLVPTIVTTVGWRWAYVAGAVLGVFVVLLVPRDGASSAAPTITRPDVRIRRRPGLLILFPGAVFATFAPTALANFGVSASVDAGIGLESAGLLLSAGAFVSILARLTWGALVDRRGGRGLPEMAVLLVAGSAVFGLSTVASGTTFAIIVLVAFATGWAWPGLMTFSVVRAHPDIPAASTGFVQGGIFLGSGLAPLIVGTVADTLGFGVAFGFVAGALATAAILLIVADRRARARVRVGAG